MTKYYYDSCTAFFSSALMITVITGTPTICVTVWAVLRLHFHDTGYNPYLLNLNLDLPSEKGRNACQLLAMFTVYKILKIILYQSKEEEENIYI